MLERLTGNTPELSDNERAAFFNGLDDDEQAQMADLLWLCPTPEKRQEIYTMLRQWMTDAHFGIN